MRMLRKICILLAYTLAVAMLIPAVSPLADTVITAEAASNVKLRKTKLTLYVGKTATLKVNGTNKTVKWTSSDKSVATVTSKGKVTAKKAGTVTITATVNNKKYTCKITVKEIEDTTVYGKVTKINGKKIILALGTLNTPPVPPSEKPGEPDGHNKPDSDKIPDEKKELLSLSGESITIKISDTGILTKETMVPIDRTSDSNKTPADASATMSDITEGSILKVIYKEKVSNLVSVTLMEMMPSGGGPGGNAAPGGDKPEGNVPGGGPEGGVDVVNTGTSAYTLSDGESLADGTYTSVNTDENSIRADSVIAYLSDVTVEKSGASSDNNASSFYGLNSAILALGTAKLSITGGSVKASAEGANGVFAYGKSTIYIMDTRIDVSGDNAGGIQVAGGGTLHAINLTVSSKGKAAIRSDRGGGIITVSGGTYTTGGASGAPAIYSTADITVNNATLTSNNSEAVVVEGLNSVVLNNCKVTGNMSGTYGSDSGENIHNVMLYQSMSGDAQAGNSTFSMKGGSLTSKNGDMFYVTNTKGDIILNNVELTLAENANLLTVAGNNGARGWGKAGVNGGNCNFTVTGQNMTGDIKVDPISKLNLKLRETSSYTGAINKDGTTTAVSVTMDPTSIWTLTGDSYIAEFYGSLDNVVTNGYTLYVNNIAVK